MPIFEIQGKDIKDGTFDVRIIPKETTSVVSYSTKLTMLPNGFPRLTGFLNLRYSGVTILPFELHVDKNLALGEKRITSWPFHFHVGGNIDFRGCKGMIVDAMISKIIREQDNTDNLESWVKPNQKVYWPPHLDTSTKRLKADNKFNQYKLQHSPSSSSEDKKKKQEVLPNEEKSKEKEEARLPSERRISSAGVQDDEDFYNEFNEDVYHGFKKGFQAIFSNSDTLEGKIEAIQHICAKSNNFIESNTNISEKIKKDLYELQTVYLNKIEEEIFPEIDINNTSTCEKSQSTKHTVSGQSSQSSPSSNIEIEETRVRDKADKDRQRVGASSNKIKTPKWLFFSFKGKNKIEMDDWEFVCLPDKEVFFSKDEITKEVPFNLSPPSTNLEESSEEYMGKNKGKECESERVRKN